MTAPRHGVRAARAAERGPNAWAALTDRLREAGIRAVAKERDGDAATEIMAAAAAANADLIVMGTHGRTGLKRLVLGSVARNVIQHAMCSVLVVRDDSGAVPPGA